jgi:hypothetical protein
MKAMRANTLLRFTGTSAVVAMNPAVERNAGAAETAGGDYSNGPEHLDVRSRSCAKETELDAGERSSVLGQARGNVGGREESAFRGAFPAVFT